MLSKIEELEIRVGELVKENHELREAGERLAKENIDKHFAMKKHAECNYKLMKEIEALQKGFLQQGKIAGVRSVNINYYTLIIETGNAIPSLILATAKKRREPLDEAREIFKKLLPNAHIRVVQLRDVINLEHLPEVE